MTAAWDDVSIGDPQNGYPCPRCQMTLTIIEATPTRAPGAWCPRCHTVWREADEVDLSDLDEDGAKP